MPLGRHSIHICGPRADSSCRYLLPADVAEGIALASVNDQLPRTTYNVCTGRAESIVQFADALKAVISGSDIEVGPGLDFFEYGSPGGYYVMDPTRAREDLGFEARFSLEDGVRAYVDSMRRLELQPQAVD